MYAGYTICTSREHIVYGAFCGSTGLYRRPAKQYERDSSMTDEVHDTNLILPVFLNLKK